MSCIDEGDNDSEFIFALSQTENLSVYQSRFIQRIITKKWDTTYKWFIWLSLIMFVIAYSMIIANIFLLDYSKDSSKG